jgi:hypothetical protein
MALSGTATTTPDALLAAIIATLQSHYSTRFGATVHVGLWNPYTLKNPDGSIALATPAILLEPGPSALIIDDVAIGRGTYGEGELIDWHAYHIVGQHESLNGTERDTWEMATITRACLRAPDARGRRGQRWGLADAVDVPTPELTHEPVDIEAPGYSCRRLTWRQAVRFADDYTP